MKNHLRVLWCLIIVMGGLQGCMTKPSFINEENPEENRMGVNISPVHFRTSQEFNNSPPQCIAILPLVSELKSKVVKAGTEPEKPVVLTEEQLKKIRWILYSHLAPFPFRDVELNKVDEIVKIQSMSENNYHLLGKALHCDTLLVGEVTAYATDFLGFYSHTSIGTKLKLIRADDKKILWQGRHVVNSHDGGLPITPVGVAMGVFNASQNVNDDQIVRVTDVLFRRLLSTWDRNKTDNIPETMIVKQEMPPYAVTARKLVLRSGPGKKHAAKSMLYRDDQLILVNKEKTPWIKVKTADGRSGYVYGKYISQRQIEMQEIGLTQELSQEMVNEAQVINN